MVYSVIEYLKKVLLVVGISFILTSAYLGYDVFKFESHATKTSGKVLSSGEIEYVVSGNKYYLQTMFTYTPGMPVPIVYSATNPEAAKIESIAELWVVPFGFAALGLVLAVIGRQHSAPFDWRRNGQQITAKFVRLKKTKLGQRIVCTWQNPVDSKVYTFESEVGQINPQRLPQDQKISVFIDPGNPNKYWVDLSFGL